MKISERGRRRIREEWLKKDADSKAKRKNIRKEFEKICWQQKDEYSQYYDCIFVDEVRLDSFAEKFRLGQYDQDNLAIFITDIELVENICKIILDCNYDRRQILHKFKKYRVIPYSVLLYLQSALSYMR